MTNELTKLISRFPYKPWNWIFLSRNPNITIEIVEKYPDKPWSWGWLSSNPNITIEIVEKYRGKPWNWGALSMNEFKHDKDLQIIHLNKLKRIRTRVKSLKIKNWYKLYLLIKDPSQCFWKWYCGEGGLGRVIDEKKISEENIKRD